MTYRSKSPKGKEAVTLEQLADEKLPSRIVKSIDELDLPVISARFTKKELFLDAHIRVRYKKLMAVTSGLGATVWFLVTNMDKLAAISKILNPGP